MDLGKHLSLCENVKESRMFGTMASLKSPPLADLLEACIYLSVSRERGESGPQWREKEGATEGDGEAVSTREGRRRFVSNDISFE